jgi:hypothetical protein
MKMREETTSPGQDAKKRGRPFRAASCAKKYLSALLANPQLSAHDF